MNGGIDDYMVDGCLWEESIVFDLSERLFGEYGSAKMLLESKIIVMGNGVFKG